MIVIHLLLFLLLLFLISCYPFSVLSYRLVIITFFWLVQNQLQLTDAVAEVRQAISHLIVNPPDFSQIIVRLIDLFSTKVLDETTLAAVVEEIFVQVRVYLTLTGLMFPADEIKLIE